MWNSRIPVYRVSAVKLNYLHYNNHKPNNLIVCHGLMGSHRNFRNLCKHPKISSHANCYLLDMRNHGDSPHTYTHSVQQMAADIALFIKSHSLANITLMGHSMGGLGLMGFSKQYPEYQRVVDNLIIVDISNKVGTVGSAFQLMLEKLNLVDMDRPVEEIYKDLEEPAQNNKDTVNLLKTNIEPDPKRPNGHRWKPNIQVLNDDYENLMNFYIRNQTEWVNPVDVIYGGDSDYVDDRSVLEFKKLYRNFTDSNLYEIKHAGHLLHFQKPQQFLDHVDQIFKKYNK